MTKTSLLILPVVFCLSLVPLAKAGDSNAIYIGDAAGHDARVYFLADTFKQVDANIRSAQVIYTYKESRLGLTSDFKDDPNKRYLSLKEQVYVNCDAKTNATTTMIYYSDAMGGGTVVDEIAGDTSFGKKFVGPPPPNLYSTLDISDWDGITRPILNAICKFK